MSCLGAHFLFDSHILEWRMLRNSHPHHQQLLWGHTSPSQKWPQPSWEGVGSTTVEGGVLLKIVDYKQQKTNCVIVSKRHGSPAGALVKNPPADAGDTGPTPGSGGSPGGGNGFPFPYSCLGNPMDRGAWRAADHGGAKSQKWLCDRVHTHTQAKDSLVVFWNSEAGRCPRWQRRVWRSVRIMSIFHLSSWLRPLCFLILTVEMTLRTPFPASVSVVSQLQIPKGRDSYSA